MRKILVTGGAGNIGSALVAALLKTDNTSVTVVDNLSTGMLEKLPLEHPNLNFIKADVNERLEITEVMLSTKFDYVFHYAAYVGVKRTQENPVRVLKDIDGIKNVLNLVKSTSVKRVFYSSSSEVYGEPVELPQHEETTPLNSRVPYAVVKNVGEAFFRSFNKSYDIDYTIFRFFNTYGPNQSKDFVITKFIKAALKNEDITMFGDGLQTRTFCYVEDNIAACIKIFEKELQVNQVINIGGAIEITIKELAELVIELTKSSSKITYLPPLAEGDMTRRLPDNSKMRAVLNRELLPVREGILKMLSNPDFMERMKKD